MTEINSKYHPLTEQTVAEYVTALPDVLQAVFQPGDTLRGLDLADGNVNLVYRVFAEQDPKRSVIVKQALPYARIVGESYPMPLERSRVEAELLRIEGKYCPDLVPVLYHHDDDMFAIVMEDLKDYVIMRKGLVRQVIYPQFAEHMGIFMARTLFYTSDLYLAQDVKKHMVAKHINPGLCKVTEDLVFTEPYMEHPNNVYNKLLEPQVREIYANDELRSELFVLKEAFMTHAEALVHGDLHSGSIMVDEKLGTKVIDAEFAYFGPMGFDIGALLANLALSYCSQEYHAADPKARADYQQWLIDTMRSTWIIFEAEFRRLWAAQGNAQWDTELFKDKYIRRLLQDTAGFGGAKMMRRILGLAHVYDLESIPDPEARAVCESMALNIGQAWIMNRQQVTTINDLLTMVTSGRPSYPYR